MAQRFVSREHLFDEVTNRRRHLGAALLNTSIKGIDAQLHKDRGVAK